MGKTANMKAVIIAYATSEYPAEHVHSHSFAWTFANATFKLHVSK